VIDRAQSLYYEDGRDGRTWRDTYFLGVPLRKNPLDLWIYQELLAELRPDLIIETGTLFGGSAFYLASVCDLLGHGAVVTVDIKERPGRPDHPRITYLTGSSVSSEILDDVVRRAKESDTVLVVLDSDHRRDHVLNELRAYGPMVTPGSYVVVEDTIVNGHPVWRDFGPGPMEAVDAFLAEAPEFEVDKAREKLLLSANLGGYLRRRPTH
jgi:cephalosporin hydroxylase